MLFASFCDDNSLYDGVLLRSRRDFRWLPSPSCEQLRWGTSAQEGVLLRSRLDLDSSTVGAASVSKLTVAASLISHAESAPVEGVLFRGRPSLRRAFETSLGRSPCV